MPTLGLAEAERNPSSSEHHDTYGSPAGLNHVVPWIPAEHNTQVQMPVPTKTPLRRTTTSPQSLQDLPFDRASTPTDSALNPPSVPANPSLGHNPANLSLQVPAIRAQDILAEGSIPDSIFFKNTPRNPSWRNTNTNPATKGWSTSEFKFRKETSNQHKSISSCSRHYIKSVLYH